MLKISSSQENNKATIRLCGRLTKEYLPEVTRLLEEQNGSSEATAIDMTHVTFVDREAMVFLCSAKSKNIGIENCPSYVIRWIKQEGLCTNPES